LPGSSVAEQVTVNHLVVGSIPTRAANEGQSLTRGWPSPFRTCSANPPPIFGLSLGWLLLTSLLHQDDSIQLVQCAVRGRRFAGLDFQTSAGIYG